MIIAKRLVLLSLAAWIAAGLSSTAWGQSDINLFRLQSLPANMRTVNTVGNAEVLVVPNKVCVTFAVKTFDKTLDGARTINNEAVKSVLGLAGKYGVAKGDVQTADIAVNPVYPEGQHNYGLAPIAKPIGYSIEQRIGFVIHKTDSAAAIIQDALTAGANSVLSLTYETTDLRKYRDQARTQALKAAREKAEAFAVESGLKLGKPLQIQEEGTTGYRYSASNSAMMQNVSSSPASSDDADGGSELALGRIKVEASVRTIFEME